MTVRLKEASDKDFGSIPVGNFKGRVIHIGDVAQWRYEEAVPSSYYRVNGLNTITLTVEIASSANLLTVASAVKERMAELQKGFLLKSPPASPTIPLSMSARNSAKSMSVPPSAS